MRYALVFLLAGPVLAGDLSAARALMEAQLKAGDELRAKGDLDGAINLYRKAVATFREAVAKEEGKAAEGEGAKAAEPAPADDGTPEGRKRVLAYYVKLLGHESDDVRYNAVAQLGEMRAVEARDALLAVLAKDRYLIARRAAAWALGRLGKEGVPAIPALIREIGGESPLLAYMCEGALREITEGALGQAVAMGTKTDMTPAERLEIQRKWQAWFDANREKLAIPAEKVEEKVAEKPEEEPAEKPEEKPAEPEPAGAEEPE
ncbi:MAG TPA: HEAT repeat domain-containing protein [Planctomycetota bacterium]|nr:HEAT repeat domain-containing protein [Planctomycetota bacterium]